MAKFIRKFQMLHGVGNKPIRRSEKKIFPNDSCQCGSGLKAKNCCGTEPKFNIKRQISDAVKENILFK